MREALRVCLASELIGERAILCSGRNDFDAQF